MSQLPQELLVRALLCVGPTELRLQRAACRGGLVGGQPAEGQLWEAYQLRLEAERPDADCAAGLRGVDAVRVQEYAARCGAVSKSDALRQAAAKGHLELLELLLSAGADPDVPACQAGSCLAIAALPLHAAAKHGSVAAVERLLASEACTDAADANGLTALMLAAAAGHQEVVELLLTRGASVTAEAARKFTALHYAATMITPRRHAVMAALLAAGASPNTADVEGKTPLHHAALALRNEPSLYEEYAEMSSVLLQFGADNQARDCFGRTVGDLLQGVISPIAPPA